MAVANALIKAKDTGPLLRATLKQINPVKLAEGKTIAESEEEIDLTTAEKVKAILKPNAAPKTPIVILCGGPKGNVSVKAQVGGLKGQVEVRWSEALNPAKTPETYELEFEIEWPASAGVTRYQTVSNEGYYLVEVPGQGIAVGEMTYIKRHDTAPPLKARLTYENDNGDVVPINLAAGIPGAEAAAKRVTVVVRKLSSTGEPGAVVFEHDCTGWNGGTIKNAEGKVEWVWVATDTATEGAYTIEFVVEWETWPEGTLKRKQTVPVNGYFPFEIVTDLEAA